MAGKQDGFTWRPEGRKRPPFVAPKGTGNETMPDGVYYDPKGVAEAEADLDDIKANLPPPIDPPSKMNGHVGVNGAHHSTPDLGPVIKQSDRTGWWDPTFRKASGVRPAANGSLRNVGAIRKPGKLTDLIAGMQGKKLPASEIPATINGAKEEANPLPIPVEKRRAYDHMVENFPRLSGSDSVEKLRGELRAQLRALTEEVAGILERQEAHTDEGRKRLKEITAEEESIRKTLSLLRDKERADAVDFETVPTDESGGALTDTSHEATDPYLPSGFDPDPPTRFPYQATPEDIARQEAEQRGALGTSEPDTHKQSAKESSDNPPSEPAEIIPSAFRRAEKPRTDRRDSGDGFLRRLHRESERPAPERDDNLGNTQAPRKSRFGSLGTRFAGARQKVGNYFDSVEARADARRGPTLREVLEKRRTNRVEQYVREGEQIMAKNPVFEHVLRDANWNDEDILRFTEALGARHLREQSWLLNEIEGGVVLKIGRKSKEILKKGMRIIREHNKAQEREVLGRAKMSDRERAALEEAVRKGIGNGGISEADAIEYAAIRAGWFASIGYTARRRELIGLVRPILEPMWEEERQAKSAKRKTGREVIVEPGILDTYRVTTEKVYSENINQELVLDDDDNRTLDIEVARGNIPPEDAAALRIIATRGGIFDLENENEVQLLERTKGFVDRIKERHRLLGS